MNSADRPDTATPRSHHVSRAVRITIFVDATACYLLVASKAELMVAVFYGLLASQTGLLATRLGAGTAPLARRVCGALIGLLLHVLAVTIAATFVEESMEVAVLALSYSLAALGMAMAGTTFVAWLLSVCDLTRHLRAAQSLMPHPQFSLLHLLVGTTVVALLTVAYRSAASFGELPPVSITLFALHQVILFAVAVFSFGTIQDPFRAGEWVVALGFLGGLLLEVLLPDTVDGVFFVFELVQVAMITLWLSVWRSALASTASTAGAPT